MIRSQRAIDDKVYVVRYPDVLSIIHDSDAIGTPCNYEDQAISLNSGSSSSNLPQCVYRIGGDT